MLAVAWQTIRTRPALFAASFAALALGVALIAATGLVIGSGGAGPAVSRFGGDTVVVTASPVLRVPRPASRPGGVSPPYVQTLAAPPGLPLAQVRRLGRLPGVASAIADRSFSIQVLAGAGAGTGAGSRARAGAGAGAGGAITVPGAEAEGMGWPSASFGPYALAAGRPPAAPGQVVIDGRLAAAARIRTGDSVRLVTPAGLVTARVTGVTVAASTSEAPVFFTAAQAARLSGRPDQVGAAVLVPRAGITPAALAAAVRIREPGLRVLTGASRRQADPDPAATAVAQTAGLLGDMAAVSGFAAVFVVASTFSFAVSRRRRELALLRLAGATAAQVRRMVLAEALIVGAAAGVAGDLAALPASAVLIAFLRWLGVAPAGLTVRPGPWPLLIAAALGLTVALAGAWAAARRTRRVRPAAALRLAVAEPAPMTLARWGLGLGCLACGTAMLVAVPQVAGGAGLAAAAFAGEVLITAAALLGPAITPGLVAALMMPLTGGPLARFSGVTADVARQWLRAQPRRTAAVAAPVLLLTGIAGSLFALASATGAATSADLERQVTGGVVIQAAASPPGLPVSVLRLVQDTPGVASVAAPLPLDVYVPTRARLEDVTASGVGASVTSGSGPLRYLVSAGTLPALSRPLSHGTPAPVAVSTQEAMSLGWRTGERVRAWLGDGTPVRLRVVAVFNAGLSGPGLLLPASLAAAHAPPASAPAVYVGLRPGASAEVVISRLAHLVGGSGAVVLTRGGYLRQAGLGRAEGEDIGLTAALAMALLYTAIAIVNTLAMAVRERVRDLAQLRLAGATRSQALRAITWEGAAIATVGLALGLAVTAVTVVAVPAALRRAGSAAAISVPWGPLLAVAAACTLLVLVPTIAAGWAALQRRPLQAAGIPE